MDKIEQAEKKKRKFTDKMLVALNNFVCNLAFNPGEVVLTDFR